MAPSSLDIVTGSSAGSWTVSKTALTKETNGTSIIDICRTLVESSLKDEIVSMINPVEGPRRLPTLLLYNERGLQIFEEVRDASRPWPILTMVLS